MDRIRNYQKPEKRSQTNSEKLSAEDVAHQTGTTNEEMCKRKIGHYAKLCRSKQRTDRKMKQIYLESEATSAEDDWSPTKIHLKHQNSAFKKTNTQSWTAILYH